MRILFFSYEFSPSNSESEGDILYCLLREYADNPKLQIDLITSSVDEKQHLLKFGDNISVHRLPLIKKPGNVNFGSIGKKLRYVREAYKFSKNLAKENSYDFTHSFSVFPDGAISFLLKRKFGLSYIISLKEADVSGYGKKFSVAYKFIDRMIKKIWYDAYFIIANRKNIAQLAMLFHPGKDVEVIYNKGVDVHDFFPETAKANPEHFTIVCVSFIVPKKGIRFLIRAFKIISGRYGQAHLIIAGDGSERVSLQQLVRGLEMEDKVIFAGDVPRKKVAEYYQKADVFILPSLEDKMSNSILEALACGLPVITTGTEEVREILKDNENGFLVKMEDSNELVEKIEKLVLERGIGKEMGKKNRLLAEQNLSWEAISGKYFADYMKMKKY